MTASNIKAGYASQYETDVLVVGLGAAGATAAITASDLGAKVLVIEKAPEHLRGGNSRVSGQIVFWPNDVDKAVAYFRAMAGAYADRVSDVLVKTWAVEMHDNRAWLEHLGFETKFVSSVEFPELPGAECVEVMLHRSGPYGEARLWDEVIEPAYLARKIPTIYDTAAVRLIMHSGEVVGVEAEQASGR
ncbi:MAG TPA: FAD-dependent oxidoreductase, partial [Burkholderiales bacterium]|nr:FAD-dependent oxidoreductase [Burkholderiales bacterium]